jgi:hypothetical protein
VCLALQPQEDHQELGPNHVALDNCTDVSIFSNAVLLSNIREADDQWSVTGHAKGAEIIMDKQGIFSDFTVMFSDSASCNVLCQYDVETKCECYNIPWWGIRVMASDGPLDFRLTGKRYILDVRNKTTIGVKKFSKLWNDHIAQYTRRTIDCFVGSKTRSTTVDGKAGTVRSHQAKYTLAERARAGEAINLMRKIGYWAPGAVSDMLSNGGIINCPLTRADIERGIDIEGHPRGYWEGKMHGRKASQIVQEVTPLPQTKRNQIGHCDIMYVGGQIVFVALVNPMNLGVAKVIKSTGAKHVRDAIMSVQRVLSKNGCRLHAIIHDPEKSIAKCSESFPDINFQETDVKAHVVLAERLIQELKECMRSVIHSLAFKMPTFLFQDLVTYALIRRNTM